MTGKTCSILPPNFSTLACSLLCIYTRFKGTHSVCACGLISKRRWGTLFQRSRYISHWDIQTQQRILKFRAFLTKGAFTKIFHPVTVAIPWIIKKNIDLLYCVLTSDGSYFWNFLWDTWGLQAASGSQTSSKTLFLTHPSASVGFI